MVDFIDCTKLTSEVISKYAPAETLVKGNPLQTVQIYHASAETGVTAGFWTGEVGAYRLEFGPEKSEHFTVLEGEIRVHNADGTTGDFGPGMTCFFAGGFQGVFEILKPARKHFVIRA